MHKAIQAVTLVEVLIAVGVIALLTAILLPSIEAVASRSRQRAVHNLLDLLDTAWTEYYEDGGIFLNRPLTAWDSLSPDPSTGDYPDELFDRNEAMVQALQRIPASEVVLNRIAREFKEDRYQSPTVPDHIYEIYDPWGTALGYAYNEGANNFPEIRSAGPDGAFGTADDITNRK
jgi:type II secretory pathway pseudopilin PulG